MANINAPGAWRFQTLAQQRTGEPVEIDLSPPKLRLSENTSYHRLRFREQSVPNQGLAEATIRVLFAVPEGQVLRITNGFYTVELTGSSTPTFNQFYTVNGGSSFLIRTQVAESIAYELQNHPLFGNNYDVWCISDTVYIKAVDSGANFSLAIDPVTNLTYTFVAGSDRYLATGFIDYTAFCNVNVGNWRYGQQTDRYDSFIADTFSIPFTPPNNTFDVSQSVASSVDYILPRKRRLQGFLPFVQDGHLGQYILRPYFLLYGNSFRYAANAEKKLSTAGVTEIKWVQNGGVGQLDSYSLDQYVLNFFSSNTLRFLTNKPVEKWVDRDSHEYIQFITSETTTNVSIGLDVEIRYYDGTTETYLLGQTAFFAQAGNTSIDVSPNILGISVRETISGKRAYSYRLRLWHQRVSYPKIYSEYVSYKFNEKCHKPKRHLIWGNNLGAWDSYTFVEEGSTLNVGQSSFKRMTPFNARPSEELELVYDKESISSIRLSANLDKEHYKYLEGLINSTAIYYWNGSAYVQLILEGNDYDTDFSSTKVLNLTFRLLDNTTISR